MTVSLECTPLEDAVKNGTAYVKWLGEIGGVDHQHNIYLIKVVTGTDPGTLYRPTNGASYSMIRPNERDDPSQEGGKNWDWYLLSCPHDPPCPLFEELR